MNRKDLANLLKETALYLELAEANPFKAKAYSSAARAILKAELLEAELEDPARLVQIQGIGKGLAESIVQAAKTGRIETLEELKAKVDPGLVEMTRVPGLGPKKVLALNKGLGIASLGELEYACHENRLVTLKGFGAKTQAKILDGIEFLKRGRDRFLFPEAALIAAELVGHFKDRAEIASVELTGDLRRLMETVDRVELLIASSAPKATLTHFASWVKGTPLERPAPNRAGLRHPRGPWVEVEVVSAEERAAALIRTTGSAEHLARLEAAARDRGLELTETDLSKDGRPLETADEAGFYRALGLDWIPPELREGLDEIELAAEGRLPRLVEMDDLKGVFHVHTKASDGGDSLLEMARAARELGYAYLGLSDHSRSAFYAGGLSVEELDRQSNEVAKVNRQLAPFRVFHGVEADILADGSLDYPDEVLARLDFVIASVHSNFGLGEAEQTERIIKAVQHPATTILGHPTGRLLLARRAYRVDMDALLDACAAFGVAVEINAHPQRLDADWRVIAAARRRGLDLKFAVCPDAHSTEGLTDAVFGVNVARKAGLTAGEVLNCLDVEAAADYLQAKKGGR